jgi:hypothetical protein
MYAICIDMYIGIDRLPPEDQTEVEACLEGDKENLFSLGRQVRQAAPERQWNAVVTDYMNGHHPKEFVRSILVGSGLIHQDTPFINVVNSSPLFEREEDTARQESAIGDLFRASDLDGKNVLFITEYVATGRNIRRLSRLAMQHACPDTIDLATMGSFYDERWAEWHTIVPGEHYVGAYGDNEDFSQQPYFSRSIPFQNSTGFRSGVLLTPGVAKPQPLGIPGYEGYVEGIGEAIADLAHRFLDQA